MPIQPEFLHMVYKGPFPTALYGRASRDPKKKGRSVATQMTVLKQLCAKHDWPVVGIFDKDVNRSASRHRKRERDDFEALIETIESGAVRIVAAFEASRYYRDIEVYIRIRNACAQNGVLFCYNGVVYDLSKREDRRATAQDALQAEDEADGIQERNMRTHNELAATGAPVGRCPEGYVRRYDPDSGDLIEQVEHPTQGAYIREIFRRFDAGEGMLAIVRDFAEREVQNQRGAPFSLYHLTHILRNRTYIGRRVRHGEDIGPGQWPKLVDEQVFHRVQQTLRERDKRKSRDNNARWLLSGIAVCGLCDTVETLHTRKNRGQDAYMCIKCFGVTMECFKLQAYVEQGLLRWLGSPAAAAAFRSDDQVNDRAAAARRQRDQLAAQLQEARDLAAKFDAEGKPRLSIMSLASIEAQLSPQIEAAQRAAEVAGVPPILRGLVGAQDVDDRWDGMELSQQRAVVRAVVNVRLFKARSKGVRAIERGRVKLTYVGQPGFTS